MKWTLLAMTLALATLGFGGCGGTEPQTPEKKDALRAEADAALTTMKAADPSLEEFLNKAYGYVVFPNVGKGGFIAGGAFGRGEVYKGGRLVGYATIEQGTIGLQAGGQNFAEVIAFENEEAFNRFTSNRLELTAQASAVALKAGAAAQAKYTNGVAIFTYVKGGLMVEAAVGGQRFTFKPIDRADERSEKIEK
jgi:lipid-binding SYLF domain-containing protein